MGAALLAKARESGFKTSIDVVSEDSERFSKIIGPALKQVDYCILNEIEASKVTGVEVRRDGKLLEEGVEEASRRLFDLGVTDLVAIHFPEGSYGERSNGEKLRQGSLALPKGYIKEQRVQGMHFVRVYFMEYMRGLGIGKMFAHRYLCGNCLYVRSTTRMDFVRLMIVLPLQTNSELVRTRANLF